MESQKDGRLRKNLSPGAEGDVVQKQHQRSGILTEGKVKRLLTNAPTHPHGIKVMLENGIVGRVKTVLN